MSEYSSAIDSLESAASDSGTSLPFNVDDLFATDRQIAYKRIYDAMGDSNAAYLAVYGTMPTLDDKGEVILPLKSQESDPQYMNPEMAASEDSQLMQEIRQDKQQSTQALKEMFTFNTNLPDQISNLSGAAAAAATGFTQASATMPPSPMSPIAGIIAALGAITALSVACASLVNIIPPLRKLEGLVAATSTATAIMSTITAIATTLAGIIKTVGNIPKPVVPTP